MILLCRFGNCKDTWDAEVSAQGAPTQVNGKGGPRACSAQMPPGFCHLLMSHRLLPLLGSPPISAHSFPCGLALCQGFASVRKCLWEAQERTRMRDKGKGKAREGYVVWESPLGAAETPCSWGLQRHCMEHSSELVFGGREAGCLPLHCFPSLGGLPWRHWFTSTPGWLREMAGQGSHGQRTG